MAASVNHVSDNKAYHADQAAQWIGQRVVNGYHNFHDAPIWTGELSEILAKLTLNDIDTLTRLLTEGPTERHEA